MFLTQLVNNSNKKESFNKRNLFIQHLNIYLVHYR